MRASVRWALWATLAMTLVALWLSPQPPRAIVAATQQGGRASIAPTGPATADAALPAAASAVDSRAPLPTSLPPWRLESAHGDPFALPASRTARQINAAKQPTPVAPSALPPPPAPWLASATPATSAIPATRIRVLECVDIQLMDTIVPTRQMNEANRSASFSYRVAMRR